MQGLSTTGANSLDLEDIDFATASVSFSGGTKGGSLTITDGAHTAHITLVGNYTGSTFILSNDGAGGTLVKDPVAAMPTAFASAMAQMGASAAMGEPMTHPVTVAALVSPMASPHG